MSTARTRPDRPGDAPPPGARLCLLALPILPSLPWGLDALAVPAWTVWIAWSAARTVPDLGAIRARRILSDPAVRWWAACIVLALLAACDRALAPVPQHPGLIPPHPARGLPFLIGATAFVSLSLSPSRDREGDLLAIAIGSAVALLAGALGAPDRESVFATGAPVSAAFLLAGAIGNLRPRPDAPLRRAAWLLAGLAALGWIAVPWARAETSGRWLALPAALVATAGAPAAAAGRPGRYALAGAAALALAIAPFEPGARGAAAEWWVRVRNASELTTPHRMLGIGPGQFDAAYPRARVRRGPNDTLLKPDDAPLDRRLGGPGSELLRQTIEIGPLGLLLWLLALRAAVRGVRPDLWRILAAGLGCFSDLLADPAAALWIGVALARPPGWGTAPPSAGAARWLPRVGALLAVPALASGLLARAAGPGVEGRARLSAAAQVWPADPAPHLALARRLATQGKAAEALATYARADRRDPHNVRILREAAEFAWRHDDFRHAWRYYEELAGYFPDRPAWERRALAAQAQFIGRANPPGLPGTDPLLAPGPWSDPVLPPGAPLDEAGRLRIWLRHHMPDEAEQRARARLREGPTDPDPFLLILADALAAQGRPAEAVEVLARTRPDTERCLVEASLQETLGYPARTAVALRRHVAHAPEDVSTRLRLANLLWDLGLWEEAEPHYLEAARLRSTFPESHRQVASRYANWGRYARAREHYNRFQDLGGVPTYADAAQIALALHRTGSHREAQGIVRTLLESIDPRDRGEAARLWILAGSIHVALEQPDEAYECFQAALRADPRHPDAHYDLGLLLSRRRRMADALRHFDLAKEYGYPAPIVVPDAPHERDR